MYPLPKLEVQSKAGYEHRFDYPETRYILKFDSGDEIEIFKNEDTGVVAEYIIPGTPNQRHDIEVIHAPYDEERW